MGQLGTKIDLLYNAILNGPAVQLTKYPVGAGAALTASGNTTGVYLYAALGANQVEIVAAGVNPGMWIAGGGIDTPSATSIFVLWIGRGTVAVAPAVLLGELHIEQASAAAAILDMFFPLPVFVRAGIGIALDLASNNAGADDTALGHILAYTGLS